MWVLRPLSVVEENSHFVHLRIFFSLFFSIVFNLGYWVFNLGYWVGGGPGVEGAQEEGEEGYLSRQRQCGCPGRRRRSLGLSMTRVWSSILTYCDQMLSNYCSMLLNNIFFTNILNILSFMFAVRRKGFCKWFVKQFYTLLLANPKVRNGWLFTKNK